MCVFHLWSRFKSALALSAPPTQLSFEYKPACAIAWLKRGLEHQKRKDVSSAANAFSTASRLFSDAGKMAQGRAALKLAIEANPADAGLRAQVSTLWLTSPSLVEELPLPSSEFSDLLGPLAEA